MEAPERGLPQRSMHFLSLPQTPVGRWSAYLLVLGFVLAVLNTAVVMPITESRTGLDAMQMAVNVVVGLCVVAAGIGSVFAVLARGERSWTLFVAIAILGVFIVMMVQDLTTSG